MPTRPIQLGSCSSTANLIVLDDAHASENYIGSNWSLDISREQHRDIYFGMLGIVQDSLPATQVQRFRDARRGNRWIEAVPNDAWLGAIETVSPFLEEQTLDTRLQYPWSLLRRHLHACQVFVSHDEILIRPFIPPTLTHSPFANATQRIYMSATLGLGGDLERMTGVGSIHRLPIPRGWDKQGIGRRFFMFPGLSLPKDDLPALIKSMADMLGRTLVLVPSEWKAKPYKELFDDREVFGASDIEGSKDAFMTSENAVAVLANRYDGIDLLGDECRLLIIEGLPKAGNLQELFFMTRIASGILLNDRIRTRIIQAVGRCTRSATDYAAVCILGDDFYDWLVLKQKRSLFHPEMQGELMFGAEQSDERNRAEFLENLSAFVDHGEKWDEVDGDLREYRDEAVQKNVPGQDLLFESCSKEVDFQYSLWSGDYERSAERAQEICGILSGAELKGLRGYWNYMGAMASELALVGLNREDFRAKASDLYGRASKCIPGLHWLRARATQLSTSPGRDNAEEHALFLEGNIERIEAVFDQRSYATPSRFERDVNKILQDLKPSASSEKFEEAHRKLGEMLGFEAGNSDSDSAPDPWWISAGQLCLVTEDKNDSKPENPVAVKHVRQAASHANWIRDNVSLEENAEIHIVLVTPATTSHPNVPTYAEDVGWWQLDCFCEWARGAIGVLRSLRSTYTGPGNVEWRDHVRSELLKNSLGPRSIVETATRIRLRDVPVE